MLRNYHSTIRSYISEGKLPLWVVHREAGLHPARLFHDHEYSEIALIISGSARHILESENIPIEAGDLLVIHPGASMLMTIRKIWKSSIWFTTARKFPCRYWTDIPCRCSESFSPDMANSRIQPNPLHIWKGRIFRKRSV